MWPPLLLEQRPVWECKQQGKLEGDRKKSYSLSKLWVPSSATFPPWLRFPTVLIRHPPVSSCTRFKEYTPPDLICSCFRPGRCENKLPVIVRNLHHVVLRDTKILKSSSAPEPKTRPKDCIHSYLHGKHKATASGSFFSLAQRQKARAAWLARLCSEISKSQLQCSSAMQHIFIEDRFRSRH